MEEQDKNQHFKNLLSIALADGILDKSELDFIFKRSGKYYITQNDLDNVAENSVHIQPIGIKDEKERSKRILDLIELMLLDGEIHETERRMCVIFGVSLGYAADNIEPMIDVVTELMEKGIKKSKILKIIQSYS